MKKTKTEKSRSTGFTWGPSPPLPIISLHWPTAAHMGAVAFPNPFTHGFTLQFEVPSAGTATVDLFDMTGRWVANLYQNGQQAAGMQQLNLQLAHVDSGIYICRVSCNGQVAQVRLVKM